MSDHYRDEFPVTKKMAYFNHAAVAPLSKRALERVHAWANDMAEHGDLHEGDWWVEIEEMRARAARLLHAEKEEIAILKNTSEGIGFVAEGFPWKKGDNVVIAQGEYPANVYPWMHLQSRGVAVKTVPERDARIPFEEIEAAIDERTRLLSISFIQFATGFRSDLAALGRLCRDRGIDFCVDAIQGLGVFDIDMRELGIDYLTADGHKWLVSPEGAAIFAIAKDNIPKIRPVSIGWKSVVDFLNYSTIDFRLRDDAARFENGTLNVGGTVALGASLTLFEEVGIETINSLVKRNTDDLVTMLEAEGATIVSSRREGEWSGIVCFQWPDEDARAVVKRCRRQDVIISTRAGRLRASPHFYTNAEDLQRLRSALVNR
ncbi:Cysteine desulfurase [Planctomycetes bacterium Pan216]|uniref:Cysteine desulfurase n=1 Tax=Kolteria novifilia TaxID=2527975 RepID=A0A518B712_9BACT|nr:Cysteine desulfurase [Planctomycetes bacterium Pan216]